MNQQVLEQLGDYKKRFFDENENHAREILQYYLLNSLSKTSFFSQASFHGGTALHLIHKTKRFSEDLDFVTDKPIDFDWKPYLVSIEKSMKEVGFDVEAVDKSDGKTSVKKAYIKEQNLKELINSTWDYQGTGKKPTQKILIKLEIDSNPPAYGTSEKRVLTFPQNFFISAENLPTMFAGKCHALLCRAYEKGRDWYDFLWYTSKGIEPNYKHLTAAVLQTHSQHMSNMPITRFVLLKELKKKVDTLNFKNVIHDIKAFSYDPKERNIISKWNTSFFHTAIDAYEKKLILKDRKREQEGWER